MLHTKYHDVLSNYCWLFVTSAMHTFTETKLTYSDDDSTVSHDSHPKAVASYQNKSRAEQTIESIISRQRKEDLPDDFIQKFHTINGTR